MQYMMTPLHYAARKGYIGVVKKLIERKADLEATDKVCPKFDVRWPGVPFSGVYVRCGAVSFIRYHCWC